MGNIPRKHHFVPRFYLAGFTGNGMPEGRLYVLDKAKEKQWPSTAKGTGHQRDFHSVDLGPGVDPMGVEKKLAHMEGQQSTVLNRILEEEALPPDNDEAVGDLMGFVAFMAVRVPRIRNTIEDFVDRAERERARSLLATEEGQDTFRKSMEALKATLSPAKRAEVERFLEDDPDLSKMAEFAGSDRYVVSYDQTWDVQTMLRMGITLMLWLSLRNWSLWVAEAKAPDLVCSDSPVSLTWAPPLEGPWPPGFGLKNTIVSLPLNGSIALVGKFEPSPAKRSIGKDEVAAINSATCMYAQQVFSPKPDFVWKMSDGRIGGKDDLLAALQSNEGEPEPEEEPEAVMVTYDRSGGSHETRIGGKKDTTTFPLRLTGAQRKAVAEQLPDLRPRLLLDQSNQRTLQFTLDEMKKIAQTARAAVPKAQTGAEHNSLRHVVDAAEQAVEKFSQGKIHRIPASERLYQFKITLKDIKPLIWRRIQVKDCTLDKFHERIQTAMGWTNSHLHQFKIGGLLYGDPQLLLQGFEDDPEIVNSLDTRLGSVVPEDGKRLRFEYEYDFGDGWEHDVLFEGCLRAEKGARYPRCLEGERACPPEDVGGPYGYEEYVEAMADPEHEEHESFIEWSGPFDPEAFDAQAATKVMRRGFPNWREME